jgi:hypothetical protein
MGGLMARTTRLAWLTRALCGALCAAGLSGCVERRFVISSEPFGAIVYDEKGQPVGASPADRQFTYYGKYRFTLVRDGYQTLIVEEQVKAPWYEYFPLDFIAENVIPFTIRDVRHFNYQLQPAQVVPAETVLEQAQQRRAYGKTKGVPLTPEVPPPASVAVPSVEWNAPNAFGTPPTTPPIMPPPSPPMMPPPSR